MNSKSAFSFSNILAEISLDPEIQTISDWFLQSDEVFRRLLGRESTREEMLGEIASRWVAIENTIEQGLKSPLKHIFTLKGMPEGMAYKYYSAPQKGTIVGSKISRAMTYALALSEGNISSLTIVALPTAGACGVVGPVIRVTQEDLGCSFEQTLRGMTTAIVIQSVFSDLASLSGAKHGCQAEVGAAAAMAAGAVIEMVSGDPQNVEQAVAIALQFFLGLVCDPVGGFVICPCIYRNAIAVSVALASAELVQTGITFPIHADEVIQTMAKIGDLMPESLKETGLGGLADTESSRRMVSGFRNNITSPLPW
jgi:L-serine dehydratase